MQTFAIVENNKVREMTEEEIAFYESLEEQNETDELK